MDCLKCLTITFDDASRTYFSGDIVSGNVQFSLDSEVKLKYLGIECTGQSKCYWSSGCQFNPNRKRVYDEQLHFNYSYFLLANYERIDNEYCVGAGVHSHKFAFRLPENLPTFLEKIYGRVFYCVKVKMSRGDVDKEEIMSEHFWVVGNNDLNITPHCNVPLTLKMSESINHFYCIDKERHLTLYATIKKRGVCPGDIVVVKCRIKNDTNHNIIKLTHSLIKTIIFTSHYPYKEERLTNERIITKETDDLITSKDIWYMALLLIPATLPSTPSTKNWLIKIQYTIQIKATTSKKNFSVDLRVPLVVGTSHHHDVDLEHLSGDFTTRNDS